MVTHAINHFSFGSHGAVEAASNSWVHSSKTVWAWWWDESGVEASRESHWVYWYLATLQYWGWYMRHSILAMIRYWLNWYVNWLVNDSAMVANHWDMNWLDSGYLYMYWFRFYVDDWWGLIVNLRHVDGFAVIDWWGLVVNWFRHVLRNVDWFLMYWDNVLASSCK